MKRTADIIFESEFALPPPLPRVKSTLKSYKIDYEKDDQLVGLTRDGVFINGELKAFGGDCWLLLTDDGDYEWCNEVVAQGVVHTEDGLAHI